MLVLKLNFPISSVKHSFAPDANFQELLTFASEKSGMPQNRIQFLYGYPPTKIDAHHFDKLEDIGLKSGVAVMVREGDPPSLLMDTNMMRGSQIARHVIDADNSCLFNAIKFLVDFGDGEDGSIYRMICASEVLSDPELYSSSTLGKPTEEYAEWIQNKEHWGGEIEMNILANNIKIEIAAIEIQTGVLYVYGRGNAHRIYLLYDGIHYDAIIQTPVEGGRDSVVRVFNSTDIEIETQVKAMAADLKGQRQFVDLAGCSIKCLVCQRGFQGQKEAAAHASQTGHQNFGQI